MIYVYVYIIYTHFRMMLTDLEYNFLLQTSSYTPTYKNYYLKLLAKAKHYTSKARQGTRGAFPPPPIFCFFIFLCICIYISFVFFTHKHMDMTMAA
jgi:hypothetical protein